MLPGIVRRAVERGHGVDAQPEVGHVGARQRDGTGLAHEFDGRSVGIGHEILQRLTALIGGVARLVQVDLDRERHAVQDAEWSSRFQLRVSGVGFSTHLVGPYFDDGVDHRVHRLDPFQMGLDDLA